MFLIIGLGNPGIKYANTRHNIGFMVIDALNKKDGFLPFGLNKKTLALESAGTIDGKEVILIKPQTFMNESGKTIKGLVKNRSVVGAATIVVVHDDADLFAGTIKISKNRGAAGHHGVESVISELKNKNLTRIRIGVSSHKSENDSGKKKNGDLANFVLKRFSKRETELVSQAINKAIAAIETIVVFGEVAAMNSFNNR
jgi:PTH1 family peptidyl-tRNA hydrolase